MAPLSLGVFFITFIFILFHITFIFHIFNIFLGHWGEDQMCWGRDALRASGERSRGVLRERGIPENRRIGRKTWENEAIRGILAPEYLLFWGFTVAFHNFNVCPNSRARGDQFKGCLLYTSDAADE